MKWNKQVDEKTKEKVEFLYKQFDKFIQQNHQTGQAEDNYVMKQWANFKVLIEKNPTDFDSLQLYIQKMAEAEKQDNNSIKISKSVNNLQGSVRKTTSKHEITYEIDKKKFKKITGQLLQSLAKNNRQVLKM